MVSLHLLCLCMVSLVQVNLGLGKQEQDSWVRGRLVLVVWGVLPLEEGVESLLHLMWLPDHLPGTARVRIDKPKAVMLCFPAHSHCLDWLSPCMVWRFITVGLMSHVIY